MRKTSIPASRGPLKMRDVARLAGVATATVSRAINNSDRIDPATAARVRAVILEMNYVPLTLGVLSSLAAAASSA